MARLPYPTLEFDNLTRIIDIIRAGQIVEKRSLFANLVWNVQGPLMALALGNPDKTAATASVEEDADLQADFEERLGVFAEMLDRARLHYGAVQTAAPGDSDAKTIDPATILAIINLVLQLIDAWRKRKQNPQQAPIPQA
jgi:hypothetical protein